jgi:RNase P/RNase MRP subunit p29
MNASPLSDPAREVVALLYSSEVQKSLVDAHPDLLELFIQAAEVAAEDTLTRRAFIGAVARVVYESDRAVEILCTGDSADFTEQMLRASQASENLGQMLKQLCPTAVPIPIGGDSSSASN